ncbi:MAG: ornithine cyclodeaminase family protein [Planctomycetaceae bacterium]
MKVRFFTADEIRRSLPMSRAIELMRGAFASLSMGEVESPVRTVLTNEAGTVLYKPAYSSAENIFCAKIVSVFQGNSERQLPVTPGIIVVNDGETGMPIALLEAGYLTALRTGAATGLATDLLAKPNASVAALFGTGGQAWHQLEAMLCVRNLQRVYVFSRRPENAKNFCDRVRSNLATCELIPTSDHSVLAECDVVTTATTSAAPVFDDDAIPDALHINAVGSLGPNRSEIPPATILRATVIVDQRAGCLQEAGEILPLMSDGRLPKDFSPAELGELVSKANYRPERPVTVFKSAGNAIQDLVCSAEVLKIARENKMGRSIEF